MNHRGKSLLAGRVAYAYKTEAFGKPLQVATAVPAASERTGGYTADFSVLLPAGQVRFPPVGAQG
jgi:hypothetical protein